jgi:hypothetical protein
MTGLCLRCVTLGLLHRHHVTLRDERGEYLHPSLVAPLCHECHRGLHRLLQKAHAERVDVVTPDVVELRISIFEAWLDWPWLGRATAAVVPSELQAGIASVLAETARCRLGPAA